MIGPDPSRTPATNDALHRAADAADAIGRMMREESDPADKTPAAVVAGLTVIVSSAAAVCSALADVAGAIREATPPR